MSEKREEDRSASDDSTGLEVIMSDIRIKRDELYEQVWAQPLTTLAASYGLSDVGLRKICKKLKIPLPGRGFWQRIGKGR